MLTNGLPFFFCRAKGKKCIEIRSLFPFLSYRLLLISQKHLRLFLLFFFFFFLPVLFLFPGIFGELPEECLSSSSWGGGKGKKAFLLLFSRHKRDRERRGGRRKNKRRKISLLRVQNPVFIFAFPPFFSFIREFPPLKREGGGG